ncbi:single-stranded-DNA-specific exonuclease RecJ, partial [Methylobacterium sp. IIF4SW-B5]|nr:single-stranded-DNA-specific exonuclease RecJ [Methylobacterium ajmalii]
GHVKAQLRGRDGVAVGAIAFRAAESPVGRLLLSHIGRDIHAAGTLSRDRWRGADRVELRLCDVAEAS